MTQPAGHILVIDSDSTRAELLGWQVGDLGFTATPAEPGAVAGGPAPARKDDLVIVDASLPIEFIAGLRASRRFQNVPILLIASDDQQIQARLPHVDDCLKRPLNPTLLRRRLTDLVHSTRQDDRVRVERDLEIAREIQRGFLPQELPSLPGWQIAARFEPAYEVAGDFYDVFYMSNRSRVGFIVADVCDKGIGSALFMGLSRSLLRAFAQQNYTVNWGDVLGGEGGSGRRPGRTSVGVTSLKNAVTLANNYIAGNHGQSNMFATLFFGVLDPESGQVHFVNAGHNPPLVVNAAGALQARLGKTGPPVGVFPDLDYEIGQAELQPGDLLLAFTDGVVEAKSPADEQFSDERLEALLAAGPSSADAVLAQVQQALRQHVGGAPQSDDITMLALRRESHAPAAA